MKSLNRNSLTRFVCKIYFLTLLIPVWICPDPAFGSFAKRYVFKLAAAECLLQDLDLLR